jgi:DNA mismatch endonuclease (patch repair protein)
MADVVDPETRSRMMAGIASRNTKPEILVRRMLHKMGLRYRLHRKDLPGNPDLVLPRYNVAVLVNGCFWHGHECRLFKWPKSNRKFWKQKITANRIRDQQVRNELRALGWHVMIVWECSLRGKTEVQLTSLATRIECWIKAETKRIRIKDF